LVAEELLPLSLNPIVIVADLIILQYWFLSCYVGRLREMKLPSIYKVGAFVSLSSLYECLTYISAIHAAFFVIYMFHLRNVCTIVAMKRIFACVGVLAL
jgi:hypothetical protein